MIVAETLVSWPIHDISPFHFQAILQTFLLAIGRFELANAARFESSFLINAMKNLSRYRSGNYRIVMPRQIHTAY